MKQLKNPNNFDGVLFPPLPPTEEEIAVSSPKIGKFTDEDIDRELLDEKSQKILKDNNYKLPSNYIKEDVSTIDNLIVDVQDDLVQIGKKNKKYCNFSTRQKRL